MSVFGALISINQIPVLSSYLRTSANLSEWTDSTLGRRKISLRLGFESHFPWNVFGCTLFSKSTILPPCLLFNFGVTQIYTNLVWFFSFMLTPISRIVSEQTMLNSTVCQNVSCRDSLPYNQRYILFSPTCSAIHASWLCWFCSSAQSNYKKFIQIHQKLNSNISLTEIMTWLLKILHDLDVSNFM